MIILFACSEWEKAFVRKAEEKGMGLPVGACLIKKAEYGLQDLHSKREENLRELEKVLDGFYKRNCEFVLVVIPKKNGPIYAQVRGTVASSTIAFSKLSSVCQ